jgi:hypothetical protein
MGRKTRVFFINLIIFPKWLLTYAKAGFILISGVILFLLQNIIIFVFDCK